MPKSLLVLRHGPAGERADFARRGRPDSERPLTPAGRREVEIVAKELRAIVPDVSLILHSPYVRTTQTAEIVAKVFKLKRLVPCLELRPHTRVADTWRHLKAESDETVMIIGHQPHLGRLLNFLLTSQAREPFYIKKTGFAWFDLRTTVQNQTGAQLKCFLQPSITKKLRNRRKK